MNDTATYENPKSPPIPAGESERDGWPAVRSLALGSFALVLSEFLPIGLLPAISAEFGVAIGTAGIMVVATGLAAAVGAPLVTVLASRMDRRHALLWLSVLLVVANILGAIAPNFTVLVIARVLLGIAVGAFWAIGAGLGSRLVPATSVIRATSLITAGISVATVLSLPLSSYVSEAASWRVAFMIGAGVSVAALVAQLALLPSLPAGDAVSWSSLRVLTKVRTARAVLIVTLFAFLAQFTAYTFVAEFLKESVDFSPSAITGGLLVLGVAGIVGNFVASVALARSLAATVLTVQMLLVASVISLPLVAWSVPGVLVLLALWGLVWGALPLIMQTWMLRASPSATEGSLAIFVTTIQFAIAAGSIVGGLTVSSLGLAAAFYLAGAVATLGIFVHLVLSYARPKDVRGNDYDNDVNL